MRIRRTQTETVPPASELGAYGGAGSRGRKRSRSRQMNPRQRQGILLLVIAAAGMIAVFVLISSYVGSVNKRVGPLVQELVLTHPLKPYQPVTSADLGFRTEPAKWAGANVLTSETDALNLITTTPLDANTVLQRGMLSAPPQSPSGDDEFALYLGAESAVAGQVQTGDSVDIVGTFGGNDETPGVSRTVVHDVKVLNVGGASSSSSSGISGAISGAVANATSGAGASAGSDGGSIPVLLALTPHQMLLVEGAKSWASDLSLALLGQTAQSGKAPAPVSEGDL